jgi:type IV pilus assembly protein PilA
MAKKFLVQFERRQKGFTLIELLVVIGILGVLAAIVAPNIGKFIGYGRSGTGAAELAEMQNCVVAMMADKPVSPIVPETFGNTGHSVPPTQKDLATVDGKHLTNYIVGGMVKVLGSYTADANGQVTQDWYPVN